MTDETTPDPIFRSGALHDPDLPRPEFPAQEQAWPGLAADMQPRPDHGEKSYRGTGRLAGKRALITGGDSGIGAAVAIAYAREGADVAINYLPDEQKDADTIIDLIKAEGRTAVAIPGDIRDEDFCKSLVRQAVEGLGGLDVLVNNAGHQQFCEDLTDLSTESFDATIKTNIYAPFWITKAALPHMENGASIIMTASVQAFSPSEILVDYALTKAANVAFARSMAKQLAPKGIRANAVCPGPYWTPLQVSGGQPTDAVQTHGKKAPLGRPGQPVEIAPIYVLLASDEASYITGEYFGSTGGKGL
ncbi:SDR family oxidoreductase [Paracoccus sp. TK19116]|uniref:SDR family oxidoreductase n=1 Tax=Paracoccus albicereus TaxID=2922394 RepID=A0ABT1MWF1_9RHOB|nr:SDR family oxidoreductase [Paracoccus albicereus]MCQ0971191.1 SDR family oxidoreductase [Paracoccus albicereus]